VNRRLAEEDSINMIMICSYPHRVPPTPNTAADMAHDHTQHTASVIEAT